MTSRTKVFLFALKNLTVLKTAFFLLVVLLAGNLNAIVDSVLHPEIHYFDEEHLIVGGTYALLVCILFLGFAIYHAKCKQAEDALRESEDRYRNVFDNARDIILTVNKDMLFTSLNPAFEKITGWQREEWLGKSFAPILHPDDLPKAVGVLQKVMQGETPGMFELCALKKSGEYFVGEFTVGPIKLSNAVTVLGHVRDVTKRKNLEAQLNEYSEHLEEMVKERTKELEEAKILADTANRAMSDFLANMSHELTTPLNSIIGFSQILQDGLYGELNERQKEYVSDVLSSGQHLLGLITDMLDLSRATSGSMEIRLSKFLVKDVLKSSMTVFKEEAMKRKLNLSLDIAPDADSEIEADSEMLNQVMFNLLSNAVKFTPDGGSVRVQARHVGAGQALPERAQHAAPLQDFIEISVADTGIGIKPEDLPRILKEAAQLESPYTKKYSGTGIGLVLTKKLVELHGGRIWAESDFGKGSKFTFVIPLKQNTEVR